MSLKTRTLAAVGTAAVALSVAAPAMATTTTPVNPQLPAAVAQLASKLPPMPSENATDAQIEAWVRQAAAALGLPTLPTENSSEAEVYTFANSLVKLLGLPALPSMSAPDSAYDAWVAKVATTFGLPTPPASSAGEAAWEAWFTKLATMAGVDVSDLNLPTGPAIQTDYVPASHGSNTVPVAAAAVLAGFGVVVVARRRMAR